MNIFGSKDKQIVNKILAGDGAAWQAFVEQYTDWVLYTCWHFEKKFCRKSDRINNCALLSIMRQRKGQDNSPTKGENVCDEGIELYLWLLQYLRNRLKPYRGESKLSTFIWTILNSKNLYVDILRWKYGRLDENNDKRLPAVIQKLSKLEQKVFVCLRKGKNEAGIGRQLDADPETIRKAIELVRSALLKTHQLFLVECPVMESLEALTDNQIEPGINNGMLPKESDRVADKIFYQQVTRLVGTALKSFDPGTQKLLKLYYNDGMSGKEICDFCGKFHPGLEAAGMKITAQNIYYVLGKLSRQLIELLHLDIDGQKLTAAQWERVLAAFKQDGINFGI